MVGRKAFARLEVTAHAALGAFVLAADTDGLAGGSENLRHGYLVPDERAHSEHSPIVIAAIAIAAAISPADRTFIRNALAFDNVELSRAQVAIDSTNLLQRRYAQRVTSDITQTSDELIVFAREYRVLLYDMPSPAPGTPATARPASRESAAETAMLSSTLAPARYFRTEVASHRTALALFTRESRKGGNAALRDFAKRTLSVVRSNLIEAQHYLKQELSREKHGGL